MHPRKGDGIIESLVLVKLSAKQQKQHNYSQFFPLYPSNAQLLSYLRTDCFTWLKRNATPTVRTTATLAAAATATATCLMPKHKNGWIQRDHKAKEDDDDDEEDEEGAEESKGGRAARGRAREELIERDIAERKASLALSFPFHHIHISPSLSLPIFLTHTHTPRTYS